jgi:hypothetical protein
MARTNLTNYGVGFVGNAAVLDDDARTRTIIDGTSSGSAS